MPRKILYNGKNIQDDSLVVGNHGAAQIIIKGDFAINGLVYCPRYRLQIFIKGNGNLSLRGICKRVEIVRVSGNCVIDFEELTLSEIELQDIKGRTDLILGKHKHLRKGNLEEEVLNIRLVNKNTDSTNGTKDVPATLPIGA